MITMLATIYLKKARFPYVGRGERHWNYRKYGEQNAKSVKVVQLDMDNKYIRAFDGANMAARGIKYFDASTIIKDMQRQIKFNSWL